MRLVAVTTGAALGVLATALPALAVPAPGAGSAPQAAPERHRCVSSVPYVSGEGGYDTYRIPAVVTTRSGTVLAFAEGRVDGAGDSGDIDLVVRRSTDGGCTWGPLSVVAAGHGDTRGNPAPVIDPATGRIVLLTCYNSGEVSEAQILRGEVTPEQTRRVFVQYSEDDGRTFSAPREITDQVKPDNWRWYATGPGHATALTRGPHAGRLVVPANHSAAPPAGSADTGQEARYYGAHALYSDDGGDSWHVGYVDADYDGHINSNESSAAQLPDGRLYFSSRDQNGSSLGNRVDAYSLDGGESLVNGGYAVQETLGRVPVVQASVLQTSWPGGPLLFSAPSDPTARQAMALWRSDDAGRTFRQVTTLSTAPAAYSDLVQTGHRVGLLYETGEAGPYERIEFRLFERGDL